MVRSRVWRSRHGQSVVEYLVIAASVILAIVGFRFLFQDKIKAIGDQSDAQLGVAATAVATEVTPVKR